MEDDAGSEYGSDFTPDEEDILSSLLAQAPVIPREDSGLILMNIEDDESPQHAELPAVYQAYRQHSADSPIPIARSGVHLPVETADNRSLAADGAIPDT